MKLLHRSAIQAGLMLMCDKTAKGVTVGSKSGVTCHNCVGAGHFARLCPSKTKSGNGALVKVNIAVAKISTRAEYDRHLPETKKLVPILGIFRLARLNGHRIGLIPALSLLGCRLRNAENWLKN